MKRILALVLMGMLLTAAGAQAAINNTPHDMSVVTTYTLCEICHIPHNATGGDRLWRTAYTIESGGGWASTTTGTLCNDACHGGSPSIARATTGAHDVTNTVMVATSHGGDIPDLATLSRGRDGDETTVNEAFKYWPAGGGLADHMECTTCHNVHDNALRPFLRSMTGANGVFQDALCEGCHDRDNTTPVVGTANTILAKDTVSYSQHPSSVAYSGSTNYTPDINVKASPAFIEDRGSAGQGTVDKLTPLGGHYVSQDGTGNVIGCVTCHAVHGQDDTGNVGPETDLLALDNQKGTGASSLCQACHSGGAGGGTVGVAGDDHPIDGTGGIVLANLTATDAYEDLVNTDWPTYTNTGETVSCVGCHSAHYGLPLTSMNRTGGDADWCVSCHTLADAAPVAHHSNTYNWAGNSVVTCGDCHLGPGGTQQMTAHQGFAGIPWDDASAGVTFCHDCHDGTGTAPLDGGSVTAQTATPNPGLGYTLPATFSADKDAGTASSHLIGATFSGTNARMRTAAWFTQGGVSYYSKFGITANQDSYGAQTTAPSPAATDEILCYSCHNIMGNIGLSTDANINVGNAGVADSTSGYLNNLLLYPFVDDGTSTAHDTFTGTNPTSLFCVGCHNGIAEAMASLDEVADKPSGTHPVRVSATLSDSISAAVDAGRSSTLLITADIDASNPTYADQVNAPNLASYPAADRMDCDSCHRVHGGDTQSSFADYNGKAREFILEQSNANDFDSLCSQCHVVYGAPAAQ